MSHIIVQCATHTREWNKGGWKQHNSIQWKKGFVSLHSSLLINKHNLDVNDPFYAGVHDENKVQAPTLQARVGQIRTFL